MSVIGQARIKLRDKYKTILGRNKYSQAKRSYVFKKASDGKYYSDCSSSIAATYRECGYPITYGGSSLPSTVGFYNSKDLVDVPVKIKNGVIQNPEILCIGDTLLFAGKDSSRSGSGYVGHVEMVADISASGKVTIYGHGSGTPRATEMNAYCKSRYKQKTSTKLGNKGLIRVRRHKLLAEDAVIPKLGDRELKDGSIGSDVKELQQALISLGYSCGPDGADSEFGPNTAKAVKAFQKDKGLPQTGVYNAETHKVLSGIITPATPSEPVTPSGQTITIVNCKTANVRTGPGTKFKSVHIAKAGDVFEAPTTKGWMAIQFEAGVVGWVSEKYVKGGAITGNSVYVRTGPGTKYKSIGVVKKGMVPTPANASNADSWAPVVYDGAVCWVSKKYVK